MSGAVFDGIAALYDLVYSGKDTPAEASHIADLLSRSDVLPPARLLEWGCGTGRHARALAALGYEVTGIERSTKMLARSAGHPVSNVTLREGDLLEPSPGGPYAAVLACFHVVSYLTSDADLQRAFENAHLALKPGGVFLFDVWHGPAVVTQKPDVRVARFADDDRELIRIAEPQHDSMAHTVDVQYKYFLRSRRSLSWELIEEVHKLRYWYPEELSTCGERVGLTHTYAGEWLTARAPDSQTWGVCHLFRK